ncbi:DUF4407 domain-containing protein [Kitasatospora cineracea]|uniref:DUF4407 domain-containing protein n=1 Tax=Kitasatospora cineracea TaxID=88074 RepID=UPI0036D974EE
MRGSAVAEPPERSEGGRPGATELDNDLDALLLGAALAEDRRRTGGNYRPVEPAHGVGRLLRKFAGVKEDILDWVPEDRRRYVWLGAIVLNTGLLAGVSLFTALTRFVQVPWPFLVPVALGWSWVVVSFDAWLIASTHGSGGAAKWRVMVPRLVLSVLLGAVIAEPLVLRVFQPAIHQEVRDGRQNDVLAYESLLKHCNPESGAAVAEARCDQYHLQAADSVTGAQQDLRQVTAERDQLQSQVAALRQQLDGKEQLARDECNGKPGTGLSGRVGEGPNCLRARQEADRFRMDSGIDTQQSKLALLDTQVLQAGTTAADATKGYAAQVDGRIADLVQKRREARGQIDILDEDRALGRLADRSGLVWAAQWLLRLLLVAVDCLPVFTKLMSGSTTYDRLVSRQVAAAEALHEKALRLEERRGDRLNELRRRRLDLQINEELAKVEQAESELEQAKREERAQQEAAIDARIEERAARLRHRGTTPA